MESYHLHFCCSERNVYICSTCPSDLKLPFHCQIFESVELLFTLGYVPFFDVCGGVLFKKKEKQTSKAISGTKCWRGLHVSYCVPDNKMLKVLTLLLHFKM